MWMVRRLEEVSKLLVFIDEVNGLSLSRCTYSSFDLQTKNHYMERVSKPEERNNQAVR